MVLAGLLIPFATSIALVIGSPEAEPAQPRAKEHTDDGGPGLTVVNNARFLRSWRSLRRVQDPRSRFGAYPVRASSIVMPIANRQRLRSNNYR